MTTAPTIRLQNGVEMPQLGLGTWPMTDDQAQDAVAEAIERGYRLIDTAENYQNETGIGAAIRRAALPRGALFITTKFNRKWHSAAGVRTACEASLQRLQTDYIDLLLIHWPNPEQNRYVEAFEAMQRLVEAGLIRAAGVSNFKPAHLEKLFAAGLQPQVNQIQLDPYRRRDELLALHGRHGIVTESWSPLGRGGALLQDPVITEIAGRHRRSPGQIVLRWHVQSGIVPVPKSADAARQADNLDVFSFALSEAEMTALDSLGRPDADIRDSDHFGH